MSYLSTQKAAKFAEKLAQRVQEPGFACRQAEYESAVAESNSGLTALLASCREKGVAPTESGLAEFPAPGQSPRERLSREIYEEMAI